MFITDAQVHIWGPDTPERPWRTGPRKAPHRATPYSKEDLLREIDAVGVTRVILIPPSMQGDHNDVVLDAARSHPDRFAAMGRLDVEAPASKGTIADLYKQPGMLGVRLTFRSKPFRPMFEEGRVDWLWQEAEQAGMPMMLNVAFDQLHLVDRVAERHPGLKITLDHLCLSDEKDEKAFEGLDKMLALAKRPNVAVKASALPAYTNDVYPYRSLHPYLRRVYDAFGPKRMFWGTDFTRLPCTYRQALTMFTEEIPWLSAADQQWVMGRGVCEWTGWKLPPQT